MKLITYDRKPVAIVLPKSHIDPTTLAAWISPDEGISDVIDITHEQVRELMAGKMPENLAIPKFCQWCGEKYTGDECECEEVEEEK
jgi:hypothetical protein